MIRTLRPPYTLAILIALTLAGCSGDSESAKKSLLETGNKYYDAGQYRQASIVYRRLIQKDARYGPAYYKLGQTELKQGRWAEAIRALRRASELQPDNEDAHRQLGDMYLAIYAANKKDNRQFLVEYEDLSKRLLKRNPKDFVGLRMKGFYESTTGSHKAAIETLRQADAVKPHQREISLALAQALAGDNQNAAAEKLVREAIDRHKDYPLLYDFLYYMKLAQKDDAECERILLLKVERNPKQAAYQLELAAHYRRTQQTDRMEETIRKMVANKDFKTAHSMAGEFYVRTGNVPASLKHFEQAMEADPAQKPMYQKRIVELLALQGRGEEATSVADQLLAADKNDSEARALRAALRLRSGNREEIDKAIAELLDVVKKLPANPVVRFNLGEAYLSKGEVEQARTHLTEAIKLRPTYVQPKISMARIYLSRREYAQAQQLADEALQAAPRLIPARLARIAAMMGLGDLRTSRAEIAYLLKENPENRDAIYLQALLDIQEKKAQDAEKGFLALYRMTPPDPRGLAGLTRIYAATGRGAEAKQMLDREISANPPNKVALRLERAALSLGLKQNDEAISEYKALVSETPDSAFLWVRLGEAYRMSNRLDDAVQALQKATQIEPKQTQAWVLLAGLMEVSGKREKTLPIYEQILKIEPDHALALNNVAYMMADEGRDLDQALTYAQKAKQQMPSNPDVADTLGWVYIKKNLSDDAIKIFTDLLEQQPKHVTWRYHLAMALFQKGDRLQAKKELQVALKNSPTEDEQKKISALLNRIG